MRPRPPHSSARSTLPPDNGAARRCIEEGHFDRAEPLLLRTLQKHAGDPETTLLLAFALGQQGRHAPALYHVERALERHPRQPHLLTEGARLATLCQPRGSATAAALLDRALAAAPAHVEARLLRGLMLAEEGRYEEVAELCREGLRLTPGQPDLQLNLGLALSQSGLAEEAAGALRGALVAHPGHVGLARAYANALNYLPGADAAEVLAAHEHHGRVIEGLLPGPYAPPVRPARVGADGKSRRLRVGLLSADLRTHSVAYFVEPIIEHLDRARFEVLAYFARGGEDVTTQRLRGKCDAWRTMTLDSETEIARAIRADGVDVLIELGGLTAGSALPVLRFRPAPAHATYCGYPNTTGLRDAGYRLVDALTDPAGPSGSGVDEAQRRCVERLVRLDPCFLCYRPPEAGLALSTARVLGDGASGASGAGSASAQGVVFGSFNHMAKLTDATLALWARVLAATPGSRLLVKNVALRDARARERLLSRLERAGGERAGGERAGGDVSGIARERVELVPFANTPAEHLAAYARVDVALDTVPYCGTTTTCEALLMGVPVVTLAGRTHAGRVGVSLLSAVATREPALRALITPDEDAYVHAASTLAQDAGELARLRAALRPALLGSPLCDGPAFAARFGAALERIFDESTGAAVGAGTGVRA